tara:strand:+ start:1156 stop:1344 length:189 start_codon:yes stop_codon:yes gene_type:complete
MNEYFVEVLDKNDEWVRWDSVAYEHVYQAHDALREAGLNDSNCWYRIVSEWNDRYTYYGPCH